MFWSIIVFTFILQGSYVKGIDLNSIFPRLICYDDEQNNCHQDFIDAYPEYSMSVSGLTKADTFMTLHTRRNMNKPEQLHKCAGRLPPDTTFNPANEVIVVIMPFIASYCNVAVYREWVVQLLKRGDYNIIVIDYSWGNELDYETAVLNAQEIVRYQVIILLENIQNQTGISNDKFTLIGHSLGAQIAGMVGYYFEVRRIIGIDPAGPGFAQNQTDLKDRLDPSDAHIVEVWHCNAGKCLPNFGINYSAGHLNFVINGGTIQKACYPVAFESILTGDFIYGFGTLFLPTTCFHAQCAQYFEVSINPGDCQFVGVECESYKDFEMGKCRSCGSNGEKCAIMGFDTEKYTEVPSSPKVYYVDTSYICPYCDNSCLQLDGFQATYQSSLQSSQN